MNGHEHYREGLRLLQGAEDDWSDDVPVGDDAEARNVREIIATGCQLAQTHFLAAAAAAALAGRFGDPLDNLERFTVEEERRSERAI